MSEHPYASLGVKFPADYKPATPVKAKRPRIRYICRTCSGSGLTYSYIRQEKILCPMCSGCGDLANNRTGSRRYTVQRVRV